MNKNRPRPAREGWADASKKIAAAGDDELVWPEFANVEDSDFLIRPFVKLQQTDPSTDR